MATVTASAQISILSSVSVNQSILFSPAGVDSSFIRTMFILDDKPLTNHGRKFDESFIFSFVENVNWNNKKLRYYKRASSSGRRTFNLSWTFLPNFKESTVDKRYSRDFIKSVSEDPDVHVLKVVNMNESGTTPYTETQYNVFVRSYSETLIRRDIANNVYYYDCSLTLEEA